MYVKVTATVKENWLSYRFEPSETIPVHADIVQEHEGNTLYIATDKPARDKMKSARGLTSDLEALDAIKDAVLEYTEFVSWLKF